MRKPARSRYQCEGRRWFRPFAWLLEMVGQTYGKTLWVQSMAVDQVGPKLVFVVAAHPDIAQRPELDATARRIDGSSVVLVIRVTSDSEIDAAEPQQKLAVRMEPVVLAQGVNQPALTGVHAQVRYPSGARIVEVAALGFNAEPVQKRGAAAEIPVGPRSGATQAATPICIVISEARAYYQRRAGSLAGSLRDLRESGTGRAQQERRENKVQKELRPICHVNTPRGGFP